jgi:DNA-binding NarL/FixJ family response regulator
VKGILIVDDSLLIRRRLRRLFEERPGWAVCGEAENGSEAIDQAQKVHPDLIVIDLVMPFINGIDASRALKRLMPAIPIVMFTSFADPHIKDAAVAAGIHDLIDKSEGATSLIRCIQELFGTDLPSHSTTAA